jgi:hypothetical protein
VRAQGGRRVGWQCAARVVDCVPAPVSDRDDGPGIVVASVGHKVGGKGCSRSALIYINSYPITCVASVYLAAGHRVMPNTPEHGVFSRLCECKGGNIYGNPKTVLGAAIIRVPRSSNAGMHGDGNRGGG